VVRLVNAVTVGHTWFWRDAEQLAIVEQLLAAVPHGRRPSVWIAGCSTGEDAYTVAMIATRVGRPATILATDINTDVLAHAERGRYGAWSVRELPPALAAAHLGSGGEVSAALKAQVSFRPHNIKEAPPQTGLDLILCRNVLIYFSIEESIATVERLGNALAPGGWLLLGASEMLHSVPATLEVSPFGQRFALRRRQVAAPSTAPRPCPVVIAPREAPVDLLSEGNARLAGGDTAGALALYARTLELDPLSTEARLYMGIAHHTAGDPTSAVDSLRAALFLDADLWPASFYLALSYEKLGLVEEARREYRRVVERSARTPPLAARGAFLGDLDSWRRDVIATARERAGRP
jgi:chemotaxis protein methyltransferase CheR